MKLFVSYSHADMRFVRKLCSDLDRHGYQVWRDERDLRVGDSIAEKIREAIDDADFFLLVISPESIASPWVKREIDVGLNAELEGNIQKFLPVLYRDMDVPSLVKGKLYADFRPGRYQRGFASLLKALNFDLSSLPILAGCLINGGHIDLVCELLLSQGYSYVEGWRPAVARLEITSGYLSFIRGNRGAQSGKFDVFSPMSPIPIAYRTPALSSGDVQVCFAALAELIEEDGDEIGYAIRFPGRRYAIYFLGKSSAVYKIISYLSGYAIKNRITSIKSDMPDLLKWWSNPLLPHGAPITVWISGRIGLVDL